MAVSMAAGSAFDLLENLTKELMEFAEEGEICASGDGVSVCVSDLVYTAMMVVLQYSVCGVEVLHHSYSLKPLS